MHTWNASSAAAAAVGAGRGAVARWRTYAKSAYALRAMMMTRRRTENAEMSERARCSDATGGRMDDGHAVASVAVRNLRGEGDTRARHNARFAVRNSEETRRTVRVPHLNLVR